MVFISFLTEGWGHGFVSTGMHNTCTDQQMISDFAMKCSIFRRGEKSLTISDCRFSLVLAVIWVWKSAARRFFVFVLVSNTVQIMFSFGIFSLWV